MEPDPGGHVGPHVFVHSCAQWQGGAVARLNPSNVALAREIIGRYPRPKSALIPLLHLAQEQDGYVAEDAMEHLAEETLEDTATA